MTPVLTVSDVRAAVAWYAEDFGSVEHVRIGDAHRSQLGLPGGAPAELGVAGVRPGRRTPEHIDDPFGHQWVLNQSLNDVDPEQWGGETVTARVPFSQLPARLDLASANGTACPCNPRP